MFGGGTITSAGSAPGAWEVALDLERMSAKRSSAPSGARHVFSPVHREMITLSTRIVPIDPTRGAQGDERLSLPRGG